MTPALVLAYLTALAPDGTITDWLTTAPRVALAPNEAHLWLYRSRWRPRRTAGGPLNLGPGRDQRRYLAAVVVVRRPLRGWLKIGSDDGMVVWLDGVERSRVERGRSLMVDEDWVPLDLAPGRHRLLIRVDQKRGAWALQARLHDRHHRAPPVQIELPGVAEPPPPVRSPTPRGRPDPSGRAVPESAPLTPGVLQVRTYTSALDGRPQPYVLYVPAGQPPPAGWPGVVLLHGHRGDPVKLARLVVGHPTAAGVALVAPFGYGDIVFRGPGERDVFRALDELEARAPIDPDRVYLTGVSMGGAATFELGVRHPGRFAALAALCGSSDWRRFPTVRGRRLRPWEENLLDSNSPAALAENGAPLYCVHGTKDRLNPLRHSEGAVRAWRAQGRLIAFETPPLGHDVWTRTYGGGHLMPAIGGVRRRRPAREITLLAPTVSLTPASRGWLTVRAVSAVGPVARVHARAEAGEVVVDEARHVAALEVDLRAAPVGDGPVAVFVEGSRIYDGPGGRAVPAWRDGERWRSGAAPARPFPPARNPNQPGALFRRPVRVVYGTGDPDTAPHLRALAERIARLRAGAIIRLPVLADTALTDRARTDLVLVGAPRENRVLKAVLDRVPLEIAPGRIRVGDRTFRGEHLGVRMVYPDPAAPERTLLIIAGTDLQSTLWSRHLPELTPDWLVYDERVAVETHGKVLGDREVLGGGFFSPDWLHTGPPGGPPAKATSRPGR